MTVIERELKVTVATASLLFSTSDPTILSGVFVVTVHLRRSKPSITAARASSIETPSGISKSLPLGNPRRSPVCLEKRLANTSSRSFVVSQPDLGK